MKIALITGASSGMGREYAKQIDKMKECDEIWIVARREDRLNVLKDELSTVTRVLPFDLTDGVQLGSLIEAVKSSGAEVKYLVNAAGFGKFGDYSEVSLSDIAGMIDLNDKALTLITAALIPQMKRSDSSALSNPKLNPILCSISAYLPLENMSVYAASKAYVLSYCYALRRELKKTGITVTAVCPGWVDTEFAACAHNGDGVNGPKDLKPITTADKVVRRAIKAANKNKPVSIYGATWKAMHVMTKIFPKCFSMLFWHAMQKRK